MLSNIANVHPHAVYAAYIHGFMSRWTYIARTTPHISHLFEPLEQHIRSSFIPIITGQPPPNDSLRNLFALPVRHGGIDIRNPVITSISIISKCL
jgi:hypothetical protein